MDVLFIPLTRGYWTCIDAADWPLVSQHKWHASGVVDYAYAATNCRGGCGLLLMHRLLLSASDGVHVDHINGLHRDNRRQNLRFATHQQNMRNRKPSRRGHPELKGIRQARSGRWISEIRCNSRSLYIGRFDTPEEAAIAYDGMATELFGEFARLNFPVEAT